MIGEEWRAEEGEALEEEMVGRGGGGDKKRERTTLKYSGAG